MTWKRYVHFCAGCGNVGPRSFFKGRLWHKRCLPEAERQRLAFAARFELLAHRQIIDIAAREGIS